MHCLLLGNGLNRLSMPVSWQQLLDRIATDLGLFDVIAVDDGKPLSLLFEELCIRFTDFGKARDAESAVKKHIATLINSFPVHPLHTALSRQFNVILTTNYDLTIEDALGGGLRSKRNLLPESRYSLFRRVDVGARSVWHIHGEADSPQSIVLGFDHYAGYLQKMRNYLTSGIPRGNRPEQLRSPLRAGMHDFEGQDVHSWVDYFLRDHLHIVGFAFDFTEIDLWWLLVHKRRRDTKTGRTFFYVVDTSGDIESRERAKMSLFASLGVEVFVIIAATYEEGYFRIVDIVSANIAGNSAWLERDDVSPRRRAALGDTSLPSIATESEQFKLPIRRRRRPS